MGRISECVLHIGAAKTGSTAIQTALTRQSAELLEHGVFYPASLRYRHGVTHRKLSLYAVDARRRGPRFTPADIENERNDLRRNLSEELESLPRAPSTLLLSSEHCQSRLFTTEEITILRNLLSDYSDRITVILYLRPQHEAALSVYSTHIKEGRSSADPLSEDSVPRGYYDYGALVQRWSSVFPKRDLVVRTYERSRLVAGDLLTDFGVAARLPVKLAPEPSAVNPSLSPRGLRVLGAINRALPREVLGRSNPLRTPARRAVEVLLPGDGPTARRSDLVNFFEKYSASNEIVRSMFFPDRTTLFTPDFSRYSNDQ
jgi:hypothetical protein